MKYCAKCKEPISGRGFCPYHPDAGAAQEEAPPAPKAKSYRTTRK